MRHSDPVPRPRSFAVLAGALLPLLLGLGTATAEPRSAAFVTRHKPLVKALRSYVVPSQNLVYADVEGNIG